MKLAVVVLRHVGDAVIGFAEVGFYVQHHAGGAVPLAERGEVGEWFEAGARLAQAVYGHVKRAVDAFVPIIQAADHCFNFGRTRVQHENGRIAHVSIHALITRSQRRQKFQRGAAGLLIGGQARANRPGKPIDLRPRHAFCLLLVGEIERGVDAQSAAQDQIGAKHLLQLLLHVQGKVRRDDVEAVGDGVDDGDGEGFGGNGRFHPNHPLAHHRIQHQLLPRFGRVRVVDRVERGGLGDGGQQRRFGQGKLGRGLVEVNPGGGFDAVGQIAVEVGVEVPLQNLFFAVGLGHLPGQQQLFQLALVIVQPHLTAHNAPLWLNQIVLDHLLGDGGTALDVAALQNVLVEGAANADHVEALVGVEGAVFDGDGGVYELLRNLIQGQPLPVAAQWIDHFVDEGEVALAIGGWLAPSVNFGGLEGGAAVLSQALQFGKVGQIAGETGENGRYPHSPQNNEGEYGRCQAQHNHTQPTKNIDPTALPALLTPNAPFDDPSWFWHVSVIRNR